MKLRSLKLNKIRLQEDRIEIGLNRHVLSYIPRLTADELQTFLYIIYVYNRDREIPGIEKISQILKLDTHSVMHTIEKLKQDNFLIISDDQKNLNLSEKQEMTEVKKEKKKRKRKRKTYSHKENLAYRVRNYHTYLVENKLNINIDKVSENINYAKARSVANEYPKLTFNDYKQIIHNGLQHSWVKRKSAFSNINALFSVALEPYLEKHKYKKENEEKKAYIVNKQGNKMNPKEWGYFIQTEHGYEFREPAKETAKHYKVKDLQDAITSNIFTLQDIPEKIRKYFTQTGLKPEYMWMLGESGENNKFIQKKEST